MWTPDGKSLRFSAIVKGNFHLFELDLTGGGIKQVTKGDRVLGSFSHSKDGELMAYVVTDTLTPSDLYIAGPEGSGERRITTFNDCWLSGVELVAPERITWSVSHGIEIEG